MTQDEINRAAEALILDYNDEYDFYMVHEDPDHEDRPYEEQRAIFDAMYAAKLTITFD